MLPPGSPHREGSAPHREGSGLESRFPRFLSLKCIRETANSRPQESPRTLQNPNETMSLPILTPTPFSRDVHVPFLARRRAFRVARAAAWALLLFAAAGAAEAQAPGKPQNVTTTADGDSVIVLSWQAPSTGGPVQHYHIRVAHPVLDFTLPYS